MRLGLSLAINRGGKVAVATAKPVNTAAPAVSGARTNGQTLTTSAGAWSQPYTSVAYKWQTADDGSGTNAADIASQTARTLTLGSGQVGKYIRSEAQASNSFGAAVAGYTTSAWIGPIADVLVISGTPATTATVGSAYSFTPSSSGGHTTYTYSITNQPGWASFSTSTGALTGTPSGAETDSGIVITVTDADGLTASLASFTITVSAATQTVDVFLVAGQSNALTPNTSQANTDANIVTWDPNSSQFVSYNATAGGIGPEYGFLTAWRAANPTKTAYLVKYAVGSTQLGTGGPHSDWDPATVGGLYATMTSRVNAAKTYLLGQGYAPVVRHLFWVQGEDDADNGTLAATYQTNLTNFISAIRTDWGDANTWVTVARVYPHWDYDYAATVRLAQETVAANDAKTGIVDTDGYGRQTDTYHYDQTSVIQLGQDGYADYAGTYSFSAYSTEASAAFTAMSVQPSSAQKAIYGAVIAGLKGFSLWSKLDTLYGLASHDAQAARLNLKSPGTFDLTAVNSPTFTAKSGYAGNGTNAYLDSNFDPTTASSPNLTQNSVSIFAWSLKSGQDAGGILGDVSGATRYYIYPRYTDDTTYALVSGVDMTPTTTDGSGFWHAVRTAANATELYKNGASVATGASASAAPVSTTIAIHRNTTDYFAGGCALAGFGGQMSSTDAQALNGFAGQFVNRMAAT